MIHPSNTFSVNLREGLNGGILEEYDTEPGRITRSIEAVAGASICLQITIHKGFDWFEADGLFVSILYGSNLVQLEAWVPKPSADLLDAEDDFSFQIPGRLLAGGVGHKFCFADLEIGDCGNDWRKCPDLKNKLDQHLGTIEVAIKRRRLKDRIAPLASRTYDFVSSKKWCPHSTAVTGRGVKHTIIEERCDHLARDITPMIIDPMKDMFIDLERSKGGQWMKLVFVYLPQDQIRSFTDVHVKQDPDSANLAERAPVSGTPPSKKRASNQEAIQSSVTDTAGQQHKKAKMSSANTRSQSDAMHRKHEIEKDYDEAERESLLHAFTMKSDEPKPSGRPFRDLRSTSAPRLSTSNLSSVLDREYRMLSEADGPQRRSELNNSTSHHSTSISPLIELEEPAVPERPIPNAQSPQGQSKPASQVRKPGTTQTQSDSSTQTRDETFRQKPPVGPRFSSQRDSAPGSVDTSNTVQAPSSDSPCSSDIPPVPEKESKTSRTVQESSSDSSSSSEEPPNPEKEIKALREKKTRLQKQLKAKLKAECDDLERQLKG